jgi:hypothetical protein
MAYFDRATFKVLDNLIVISCHLLEHFLQVSLVNSDGHSPRLLRSFSVVRRRVHS